jgi:nucleotide-binding universal stress UspA family protein
MYTRMLIPLDGSKVAEQVLPYARCLAKTLGVPVEFLQVVDPESHTLLANPAQGRYVDTILADRVESGKNYLEGIARSFQGAHVNCLVEKGKAEEVVIEKAAMDKNTLIVMATHGRSGIQRWLLGSVADNILHAATNHVLLVRASDQGKTDGEAVLKTVVVPLDGSPLAERVLPDVAELAKKIKLAVVLVRAYALPPSVSGDDFGFYSADLLDQLESEAKDYLAGKVKDLKTKGLEDVSSVVHIGYGAEEIITLARNTPDNFIAMCTHGRSGVKRWVFGSVAERVVRHSGDPVLIIRAD